MGFIPPNSERAVSRENLTYIREFRYTRTPVFVILMIHFDVNAS